ncbi:hypothetical protein HME9302_00411 [Alteripontixanthobacter maritimus]|uniref:Uncharacterized protein n=1 Tax=Alteripontixanthobacter maritimus TaxID=2161824 RepID=A0A369Q6S1_9SPHN|nr:hypothetical protein [Alteripontixanthobacter maritimus]RDC59225.1 hypothetical protein HME9302_00411 [Alteripontixanthobacter maritimus]
MSESSFASLSPTLLARKGGAKPAMRPQLAPLSAMNGSGNAAHDMDAHDRNEALEDLGWNDMGEDEAPTVDQAHLSILTPAPVNPEAEAEARAHDREAEAQLARKDSPQVRQQLESLAHRMAANEPVAKEALIQETPVREAPTKVEPAPANDLSVEPDPGTAAPFGRIKSIPVSSDDRPQESTVKSASIPDIETADGPIERIVPQRDAPARRTAFSRGKRAAFTLRLDADRHLKLRLASTLHNRSAQALLTEALDALLGDMPDIDKFASQMTKS